MDKCDKCGKEISEYSNDVTNILYADSEHKPYIDSEGKIFTWSSIEHRHFLPTKDCEGCPEINSNTEYLKIYNAEVKFTEAVKELYSKPIGDTDIEIDYRLRAIEILSSQIRGFY